MALDLGHLWMWLGLIAGGGLLYVSLIHHPFEFELLYSEGK